MIYKKNHKKKLFISFILLIVIGIIVGYAYLKGSLKINGNTILNKNTWDVKFTNIRVLTNSGKTITEPTIVDDTSLSFKEQLNKPGDEYIFTVRVENNGTIDAMTSTVPTLTGLEDMKSYLEYSITYSGGIPIEKNELLKAGESELIKVVLRFKKDITEEDIDDLNIGEKTGQINLTVDYVQSDKKGIERDKTLCKQNQNIDANGKLCRRAESLHTEVCSQTSSSYYCSGAGHSTGEDIIYGNCGTSGELTSGDAFDCDVDGNGVYDSKTERFYYVSDYYDTTTKSFNNDYATLIYYNNVKEGVQNNTSKFAYDYSSDENWHGPRAGYIELPSTSQWGKVTLLNNERQLLNENAGNTTVGGTLGTFEYTDKAARFLTVQEINQACSITVGSYRTGELDTCEYLLENTRYSNKDLFYYWWLESARSDNSFNVWFVNGNDRRVSSNGGALNSGYFGVRPAIDVAKASILY